MKILSQCIVMLSYCCVIVDVVIVLCCCTTILYYCLIASLCFKILMLLYCYLMILLYSDTVLSLRCCIAIVSLYGCHCYQYYCGYYHYPLMSLYSYTAVLIYGYVVILRDYLIIQLYHYACVLIAAIMSLCYCNIVRLPQYIKLLLLHHMTTLLYHCVTDCTNIYDQYYNII